MTRKARVLIVHANGTNRDKELADAFELAGAQAVIKPLSLMRRDKTALSHYEIVAIPGGFSYADTLGAGTLFALELMQYFAEEIEAFIASQKPVIGICNGFQTLVKMGILPRVKGKGPEATLTFNESGHFECRWTSLLPSSSLCIWTRDLKEPFECPVAHGEGRFMMRSEEDYQALVKADQIALRYAGSQYPDNPNGSPFEIAGVCNPLGNVIGLMPHPEDHVLPYQHPRWTRGEGGNLALDLLQAGVSYVR